MPFPIVTAAVEGTADEVLLRRICEYLDMSLGDVHGKSGKQFVLGRIMGYNYSARHRHWVVIVDLDQDYSCAPEAIASWLPLPAPLMSFRVAVREVEAWVLADNANLALFLGVDPVLVPGSPDLLPDPKETLIELARLSPSIAIRQDMVPNAGAGQKEGPAYTSRIVEFVTRFRNPWDVAAARMNSASLDRCIRALETLKAKPYPNATS